VFTDEPVAVPVAPVTSSTSSTTSTTPSSTTTTTTTSSSQPSSVAVTGATTVTPATTTSGTTTPSSSATTTLTTASTSSAVTMTTMSAAAPVVVVRQLQTVRPYNGTTSWKLFRDHFNRVAKVNGWTSNDDLIQHLTPSLEGAAAEILCDFDDTASTALTDLWRGWSIILVKSIAVARRCASLIYDDSPTPSHCWSSSRHFGSCIKKPGRRLLPVNVMRR